MDLILKYFPDLSQKQINQFRQLYNLYSDWNTKINVISRKDMDNFYERHVLHSLSIAMYMKFKEGSEVLDLGAGGGFPGIPLAIMFPNVSFHLIDGTAKKILVINEVGKALQLKNVKGEHIRVEDLNKKYNCIVSRAVAPLAKLCEWTQNNYKKENLGLICLKGGDLAQETKEIKNEVIQTSIGEDFEEDFFKEKYIIHVKV